MTSQKQQHQPRVNNDLDTRLFHAARRGDIAEIKAIFNSDRFNVNWDSGVVGATCDSKIDASRKMCAEFCVHQGGSPFWLLDPVHISPQPKFLDFGVHKLSFGGHNISVKACDTGRNKLSATSHLAS